MNIAHHPYWNLDGSADISDHFLHVSATEYLPTDAHNLPTGIRASTARTPFDFNAPNPVPLSPDLDVNYCLATTSRAEPMPCATLIGGTGTRLDISTTAPGLQVYNGAFLPNRANVTHGGGDLQPYAGIALEPQFWPDAPHHPDFPQINLKSDVVWRQRTTYHLTPPNPQTP